jgi:hypothetical protein
LSIQPNTGKIPDTRKNLEISKSKVEIFDFLLGKKRRKFPISGLCDKAGLLYSFFNNFTNPYTYFQNIAWIKKLQDKINEKNVGKGEFIV